MPTTLCPRSLAFRALVTACAVAVVAALLGVAPPPLHGAATARRQAAPPPGWQVVTYHGYELTVPASWPVVDLAAHPDQCVRFDQQAVYLGTPAPDPLCPAHIRGRTDALLVSPATAQTAAATEPGSVVASAGQPVAAGGAAQTAHEVKVVVPDAGVVVTASYGSDPTLVQSMLDHARIVGSSAPTTTSPGSGAAGPGPTAGLPPGPLPTPPATSSPAASSPATPTTSGPPPASPAMRPAALDAAETVPANVYTGAGLDTCGAPSLDAMSAWKASPYRAVGIYLGGANRGCPDGNLSPSWVQWTVATGWSLIPIYVGLQAPGACGCQAIDPSSARSQGINAANDAVARARYFGIGPGSPIFDDMEAYDNSVPANTSMVLAFLNGWTTTLHQQGYLSGVYSSGASGITDLVAAAKANNGYPSPDILWNAEWNGQADTSTRYIPSGMWANHQRVHQYSGNVKETWGGVTIMIDGDWVDATLVGNTSPAPSAIQQRYQSSSYLQSLLGAPVGSELVWFGVHLQNYERGVMYWTPQTGAHEVHGGILWHLNQLGGVGVTGLPVTDETGTPDGVGRYNQFSNGYSIYWTAQTGAWSVHGAIRDEWAATGWEQGPMGYPITDESGTPDGVGRYNHFSKSGSIYWTPQTGAHEVHGAIRAKWAALGWERSFLSYPWTDEMATAAPGGRYNGFVGGAVVWSGSTGAHEIHGAIYQEFLKAGATGLFGFPTTDELGTPDGVGRFNHFSGSLGASIYWTPQTGAHEVQGAIRARWAALGWERSYLGYPVSDEYGVAGGRRSDFQHGSIVWNAATGQVTDSHN